MRTLVAIGMPRGASAGRPATQEGHTEASDPVAGKGHDPEAHAAGGHDQIRQETDASPR